MASSKRLLQACTADISELSEASTWATKDGHTVISWVLDGHA